MRLRLVQEANFQSSVATIYQRAKKARKLPNLKSGDVVAFIAKGQNQIAFVWKPIELERVKLDAEGTLIHLGDGEAIGHYRLRLLRGKWNPLMLANYANKAGITIDHLKRFEDHYKSLQR